MGVSVGQAEAPAARERGLPAEDCRAQLHRILNSADFEATDREHRFLSHVVEETLSGRGDRIKAYSIAVEVFGRDASFDPQSDPIVRIEAGHLRRSLERYYFTAGQSDAILITIPKGGYVPAFSLRSLPPTTDLPAIPLASVAAAISARPKAAGLWIGLLVVVVAAMAVAAGAWWWAPPQTSPGTPKIPRVLVEKFDDLTGTQASAAVTSGLAQEVAGQLSKFRDIVVLQSVETAPGKETLPPRFVLSGSVNLEPDAFRLRVSFRNRADGSILWANSYNGQAKVSGILDAQADIARNVATNLAQTYGVISQADATLDVSNAPDDWAAYSCTLSYYAYRVSLDPKARAAVRTCLEKAVERFPDYATAWALLAHVTIDEIRFTFPADPASSPAVGHALAIARHAVGLDPRNVRALHAEMSALFFSKEFDAGRRVGERAMVINPNDTDLMGGFGTRLALSGRWDDGCPLVEEARDRNPGPFAYYESILALCSYFGGDYATAAMWIKKTTVPKNPLYHVIAAGIFGEGGFEMEASRERTWLEENQPALVKNLRFEVSTRLARSEDAEFFIGSLKKAGLDIKD
jgi:TolB-like protein/Tfp pilus assembly protein PilF